MAFTYVWDETAPDGATQYGYELDDEMIEFKKAVRERLEGDPADSHTGIFNTSSFASAPKLKRLYHHSGTELLPSIAFDSDEDLGYYYVSAGVIGVSSGGSRVGGWNGSGLVANVISELTGAAGVTIDGVLIKDGKVHASISGASERMFTGQKTDVAHGMTSYAYSTSTAVELQHYNSTTGGGLFHGLSENSTHAAVITGSGTGESTTKSAAGFGTVVIKGRKANGVNVQALGANGNILSVDNNGTTVAILDVEGELHLDATVGESAWDEHDDIALLTGLRGSLMPPKARLAQEWKSFIDYARPVLESTGVVTYNEDGHHFVATKRLNMLLIDALRQLAGRIDELEAKACAV